MRDEEKSREDLIRELAELRKKCERQESILSNIRHHVLMVVSPDRTIQTCTPSVQEVFGYETSEVIGKTTDLLYFDRRSRPGHSGEIREILEKEGCHIGWATGKKKNGGTLPLEIVTGKLGNAAGAVLLVRDMSESRIEQETLKVHCAALQKLIEGRTASEQEAQTKLDRDVGERIQTEAKIRRLNEELDEWVRERTVKLESAYEELKAVDTLKDAILSSVSHEFRAPLASIRCFAEILLRYPDEDAQTQKEFLSIIQSESDRLGRLIDNVLDLSKIRAGKMEWNFQKLSVGSVVRRAVQTFKGLLATRNLEISTAIEPGLPEFTADEDRIHQVLTNLLSNAIKFSPEGGRILVAAEVLDGRRAGDRTDFVHISVMDSGIGILPEDLPKIFERFRRGTDTLAEKQKGTGLGLSICKEIVSAHRGDVWAESIHGHGSTFHVCLPACPAGDAPAFDVPRAFVLPEQTHLC